MTARWEFTDEQWHPAVPSDASGGGWSRDPTGEDLPHLSEEERRLFHFIDHVEPLE